MISVAVSAGDAVGGEQPQGQAAGAAAGRADQDALALEVGQPLELGAAGIEDPQRLVGDAPDGQQSGRVLARGEAALDEARMHAGGGVRQRLEVGERSAELAHLELDAVALEGRLVALGIAVVGAARAGGGDDEGAGRRRIDEAQGQPDRAERR